MQSRLAIKKVVLLRSAEKCDAQKSTTVTPVSLTSLPQNTQTLNMLSVMLSVHHRIGTRVHWGVHCAIPTLPPCSHVMQRSIQRSTQPLFAALGLYLAGRIAVTAIIHFRSWLKYLCHMFCLSHSGPTLVLQPYNDCRAHTLMKCYASPAVARLTVSAPAAPFLSLPWQLRSFHLSLTCAQRMQQ